MNVLPLYVIIKSKVGDLMSEIYDRIKARRQELGLTVEELANRMGYKDKSSISKIENGKTDIPQSKVKAFARALDTTTAYLIGIDEEKEVSTPVPPGFQPLPHMVQKPLVGRIACGEPITAEQNIERYVDVPEGVPCDFCLECEGDSMIDAGIHSGDLVYIRIQPEVENGQIAAVRIGEEATLKKVYYDGESLLLMPCNNSMLPRTYSGPALENIKIEGRAVGFTHWF